MYLNKHFCLNLFFIFTCNIVYAQISDSYSLEDERKKNLLKQVKPPVGIIDQNLSTDKPIGKVVGDDKVVNKDNIQSKLLLYRNGGSQFEDKLSVERLKTSVSDADLLKIRQGANVKSVVRNRKLGLEGKKDDEFIHDQLSQRQRLQGLMLNVSSGGLNLSGWKEKKKMSAKSKAILIHVLGETVDE